jgi:diguanylate cyclase (GGDEF)-like protein/PAS domain S-box-containing protein
MPAGPIRVLIVEDVKADAELEVRELKRAGLRVEHRLVDREDAFRDGISGFEPNIIISDFSMPHFDGMAALALARELAPEIPFIFVSGTIGEEYAIRALKNGATDYVLKTNLVRLPAAVERALEDARARRARRKAERKLAATRERLQSIYESLPDMLWSVELPTQAVTYVSPAATTLYGYAPQDFTGSKTFWKDVIHAEDRPAVEAAWESLLQGGDFDIEYRIVRAEGSVCWVNDRGRMIRDAAGAPLRIDGLARDISETVRQRERLARLQRIRDFSGSISAALVRQRDREHLAAEVCRIAVETGGFLGSQFGLLDPATQAVRWLASVSRKNAPLASIQSSAHPDQPSGQGIVGLSLRSGEPAIWNDVEAEANERSRAVLLAQGTASGASLPLIVESRPVGVLTLHSTERGFFDQEETALLRELSANVSFALELMAKQDQLNYLAMYDPLTELPNRTLFHDRLTQALEAARRSGTMLALTMFDIERFKAINDSLGQRAGDEVLRQVATRLRSMVGDVSRLTRVGGNTFAVMRGDVLSLADAARAAEEKMIAIQARMVIDGRDISIVAKAGVAVYPDDGLDADSLFRNAEAALKRGKQTGERVLFYAPHINARVAEQVEFENRLRVAVERRDLFLHFQPKVDLASKQILGVEALMRWRGPDNLLVSPARFVPVLEETGMILEAGRLALEIAAAVYRDWRAELGQKAPRIAVNVSALQLRQKDFVPGVLATIGDAAAGLDIEITESLLMADIDESIRKLRELRQSGLGIALDDFGTGHSSLAYLSRLPIDTLKIDRSFIHGMTEKAEDTSIVTTIVSLAQALRLKVVAEGVETEEQARLLRLLRCDQMQGYLFSPPQAKDKIEVMLRGG